MKQIVARLLIFSLLFSLASAWVCSKKLLIGKKRFFQRKKKKLLCRGPLLAAAPPPPVVVKTVGTAALAGGVGAAAALWKQINNLNNNATDDGIFTPEQGSLLGQTILITGASTGLGSESAKRLAIGGANLILTARTDRKGLDAVESVAKYLNNKGIDYKDTQKISYKLLDLDNLERVKLSVGNWTDIDTIDVLLNNAGIMALPNRELTIDGFEKQMQSNHLGPFLLTTLLMDKLSKDARIINVSSSAHKIANQGLLFEYMWTAAGTGGYSAWKSYGQSKLANIYFTRELQRRVDNTPNLNWKTVSLHPGVVSTDLGRYMMSTDGNDLIISLSQTASSLFLKTPEQGANTQVWLAACKDDEIEAGKFYVDRRARVLDDFATNRAMAARLWRESEKRTGVEFQLSTDS